MRAQYLAKTRHMDKRRYQPGLIILSPTVRACGIPTGALLLAGIAGGTKPTPRDSEISGCCCAARPESSLVSGEAFLLFETDDESAGLRLRLISPEHFDASKSVPAEAGQSPIVAGGELDARGRRRAYWIYPQALDDPLGGAGQLQSEHVDAADVLHIFDPHSPGAVRERSWLGTAATRALEVYRLEDALLAKVRVSALFCAFVSGSGETDFKPADDNALSMELGTVRVLPADTRVTFPQVASLRDAPAFLTRRFARS
jgi:hypothetical protein